MREDDSKECISIFQSLHFPSSETKKKRYTNDQQNGLYKQNLQAHDIMRFLETAHLFFVVIIISLEVLKKAVNLNEYNTESRFVQV